MPLLVVMHVFNSISSSTMGDGFIWFLTHAFLPLIICVWTTKQVGAETPTHFGPIASATEFATEHTLNQLLEVTLARRANEFIPQMARVPCDALRVTHWCCSLTWRIPPLMMCRCTP